MKQIFRFVLGVLLLGTTGELWAQETERTEGAGGQMQEPAAEAFFVAEPLTDAVFSRIEGCSYRTAAPVGRAELRYLRVLHCDAEGRVLKGELICHHKIADDLLAIFRALYEARYPIERMVLIDEYGADDTRSMEANNSSAFNFRPMVGSKRLSKHSYGLAIDINPLYNPYVKRTAERVIIEPASGAPYVDRTADFPYKITADDLCVKLFKQHGFTWGGDWRTLKDYQHFEIEL